MTDACFDRELGRLRNQWPGAYQDERAKVIHKAFATVSDAVFTDAVSDVLATCRAAPLLPELEKAVEVGRLREKDKYAHRGDGSIMGTLNGAAGRAKSEFVRICLDALDWKSKNGVKAESKEWEDVLVHLGKLCGMTRKQSLEREPVRLIGRELAAGKDE